MNVVMGKAEARRGRVITTLYLKKIIIIILLHWIFVAAGFPLAAVSRGYSLVAMHGLLITAASLVCRASMGSVVLVLGFSRPLACRIFPNQGLNPCPLHWQADS